VDDETRYAALAARDRRFDGVFFVAVETTGIYCRPICPARTPRRDRCRFYLRAAEAERDGYRACLRCRPERAPRDPLAAAPVDARARLVAHATAAIDAGALHEGSLEHLATRLGVSARHLRRVMEAELGVSPPAWAETRRLAIAKQLLQDTALPITEVALASGYRSLRRFHAAFSARFGRPPRALRGAEAPRAAPVASEPTDGFTLRLEYRPPLDWVALLGFLGARAIPGVEAVDGARWTRVVRVGDARGTIEVEPAPGGAAALEARFSLSLAPRALPLVARLRALFDLDAHPEVIAAQLALDPRLAPLVAARPGLRVPGAFEPFEVAVRALLGQQVSVRAATTLATRLVARAGGWVPDAATLATWPLEDIRALGLPAQRARALHALALAVARGDVCLDRGVDPDATQRALLTLPGVGPWTASYVAMRALGWPDALPAGDLVLRQRLELPDARAVEARAEAWRPWRAYGVLHLWTAGPPGPAPNPSPTPRPRARRRGPS
jgi:AraC family transcriptional regulator of adaptative response / DNA-3-methyladenine glycosylase II